MTEDRRSVLVLGADGNVGAAISRRYRAWGHPHLATTRRPAPSGDGRISFDLAKDLAGWRPPAGVKAAFICLGATKVDQCRRDPAASRRLNVEATFNLAQRLVESGIFVVYFSSNQVFDGTKAFRNSGDTPSPMTEYGKQKVEAEHRLRDLGSMCGILRMSKVLSGNEGFFTDWIQRLAQDQEISPFSDMFLAPTPISTVVTVAQMIAEFRLSGVFQVSGERDVTYAQAAAVLADVMGKPAGLVRPVSAVTSGYREHLPSHTTLSTERLRSELGILPPSVSSTLLSVAQTAAREPAP